MSCSNHHRHCGCSDGCFNGCSGGCFGGCTSSCPWPEWIHPICCNQTHLCCAGREDGATLVIHQIVLEACGEQSCTPRTFNIRITGPSFPCGEVFTLRAGSCIELDEPLVITGLIPGDYTIELLFSFPHQFITTLTGPVCGNTVRLTANCPPTVVTIVCRRRLCSLCHGFGCGCSACNQCNH